MNKEQYLERLKNSLRNIPAEEVENIICYYIEYFEDAGVENEQSVVEELGSPEILAAKVSADYVVKDIETGKISDTTNANQVKTKISNIWVIVVAICAFPIWLPVVITVAALLFAAVITILSLLFAIAVTGGAMMLAGIVSLIGGIILIFQHAPTALLSIGTSLIFTGVGALIVWLTVISIRATKKLLVRIAKKRIKKGVPKNE